VDKSKRRDIERNGTALTTLAVASSYMLQSSLNVMNPIIATISSVFTEIPYTTVALVATLPTLLAIPGGLIADKVVRKFGYRITLIVLYLMFIITGIAPVFLPQSFTFILLCRAVFGVAYGIGLPLCTMAVRKYIENSQHGKVIGYGFMLCNAASIVFSILAGLVATYSWHYAFYIHLLLAVPLVLALFLKKPANKNTVTNDKLAEKKAGSQRKAGYMPSLPASQSCFFTPFISIHPESLWRGHWDHLRKRDM
jgi:MFS family permease